jgi:AbrB family looped-hinge helix DNA binding protein
MDDAIIGTSKVTRNGQITLNKKIRNELGIEIGDYVIFEKIEGNKLIILPAEFKIKTEKR